jgi:hypothetical protein
MKYLAVIAALACVVSTSAVAKSGSRQSQNFAAAQDPYGVYVDGELIGRDPDPAIRAQIRAGYCGRLAPVGGAM